MKLIIDCEFNQLQLMSMALVPETGEPFYEVVVVGDYLTDWVRENVVPVLNKEAIWLNKFQVKLSEYLNQFTSIELIADWPEDIAFFCRALITGPGERLDTPPLSMTVRRDLDAVSRVPHNALEDALAIHALYFGSSEVDQHGVSEALLWRTLNTARGIENHWLFRFPRCIRLEWVVRDKTIHVTLRSKENDGGSFTETLFVDLLTLEVHNGTPFNIPELMYVLPKF